MILFIYLFLRQSLSLSLRLCLLGSSSSPTLPSEVAGNTNISHHTKLVFLFLVEMGFCHVGQAALEILTSSDPPASVSQNAGITGVRHLTQPYINLNNITEVWGLWKQNGKLFSPLRGSWGCIVWMVGAVETVVLGSKCLGWVRPQV